MAASVGRKIVRGVLAVLAVVVLAIAGFALYMKSQMATHGPSRIVVSPDVTGVLCGISYSWIVRAPQGPVLIDACSDATGAAVIAELHTEGYSPEAVRHVLITHAHKDHWSALQRFPNAQVIIGPGDADVMRGTRHLMPAWLEARMMAALPVPTNIRELHDEPSIDVDGATFRVIYVPGHTPGSVMYLHGDVLFTGDSLMWRRGRLQMGPRMFSFNAAQNLESLQRLRAVPFTRTCDGHAGLTEDAHAKLEEYLNAP